jgi:hypothetical protein
MTALNIGLLYIPTRVRCIERKTTRLAFPTSRFALPPCRLCMD